MKSICEPLTPPAALISLTASFAPFAAGRSNADSSPVRANPPPILIVPPAAALPLASVDADAGAALDAALDGAAEVPGDEALQAASTIALASTKTLRITWLRAMTPPPIR